MRVLAPSPASASEGRVTDGYQLCARCGKVLVDGESVILVRRRSSYVIHTHEVGPLCPPKAVRGWKVARAADRIRGLRNQDSIFREGEPCCFRGRTCVCVMDDRHIEAELALVEYQPSDELPWIATDVQDDREQENEDPADEEVVDSRPKGGVRNYVENQLIDQIAEGRLADYLRIHIQVVWQCREKTYAKFATAPTTEPGHAFINTMVERQVRVRQRWRSRLPKAPFDVLARDLDGRRVEFALYSIRKVLKIGKRRRSEFEFWKPKPDPVVLPINSRQYPNFYDWIECRPKARCEPVDRDNPFGPVAMMSPEVLRAAKTLISRRKHIVDAAHARPAAQPELVPALAASSDGAPGES